MALPAGTSLPPVPYLLGLLVAMTIILWFLAKERPAVSERTIVAFAPWMAAGAGLHSLYQLPIDTGVASPLLGTPSVYLTTFILAAAMWLVLSRIREDSAPVLGISGIVVFVVVSGFILVTSDTIALLWPLAIIGISTVLAIGIVLGIQLYRPDVLVPAPALGMLVVFSHALDSVSTAVGFDVLSFHERTPLSRLILEFSQSLPTAELIGAGWLFILVKLAVAAVVVGVFAEYVRERPTQGYLLLGFVVAVGLGPGTQNILLFAVHGV